MERHPGLLLAAFALLACNQPDLFGGTLRDADARMLARLSWPRLRRLHVSRNELSPAGAAALAGLCPEILLR